MDLESGEHVYNAERALFRRSRYKFPMRHMFQKRNFHAFCVGTPKSGTHSIANMLGEFRTAHEPNEVLMIGLINKFKRGQLPRSELKATLSSKDCANWFEMESSHYNGLFSQDLLEIFPRAKFILTIRDCISWVDSWFNHQLSRYELSGDSIYQMGRDNYYSRGHSYTKHDQLLEELKLYPLRSYLTFWQEHNSRILELVPSEKLLVVPTKEISRSSYRVSAFLGVSNEKLNSLQSHEFKAIKKFNVLDKIDKNYLFDTASEICGTVNDKFFTPIKTDERMR